jgi:hypothetical protein
MAPGAASCGGTVCKVKVPDAQAIPFSAKTG